jgi:osmotically-inducible protein OsmY
MVRDHDLQTDVLAALAWEPSVIAAHLGVSASGGVVTLTGHVESYAQKVAAEHVVLRVRGVKALAQEIKVKVPFERTRSDDDIAAAVIERLAWSTDVPADRFAVKVENGWVTLTGEADWNYQKNGAALDVRRLMGVVGLSNNITVKSRVNTVSLHDDIAHALHRSWFFDSNSDLRVSAEGGLVTLTGSAHSQSERHSAEMTAWAAPGVTSVVNDIRVH